ncbi:acetyl-CoA carboxylase biotin carboxylase subunit family protein [Nocardiopsis sp. CC223A]|uniref:ATP-grasp domain-containing protein n=1 Tax=Nocardiopsis sp. CC223A TaxID=3044051 RepID=UPI00278C741A|nr:hypothetical protein [Nocardiopsis sp. CC223A]
MTTEPRGVLLLNSDKPEVLRVLRRRPDVRVRVLARDRYADFHSGWETVPLPGFEDLTAVGEAARRVAESGPVDAVIAATEKGIVAAALVRALLGVPGTSLDQAVWTSHKRAMKERLRAAGIPVADFVQVPNLAGVPDAVACLGGPAVVKPVFGSGSRATHRLASPRDAAERAAAGELDDLAARGVPILVERRLTVLDEYHCDGLLHAGEIHAAAASCYFAPPLDAPGGLQGSRLLDPADPHAHAVRDLHERVVRALGLRDGVTHLEVFATPDGHVVGEVTTRPAGLGVPRMWAHAFGLDLWEGFVAASLGERPPVPGPHPGRVFCWTHLPGDARTADAARTVPGVIEVRTPGENGSPNTEVHFTAPDPQAAVAANTALRALCPPADA